MDTVLLHTWVNITKLQSTCTPSCRPPVEGGVHARVLIVFAAQGCRGKGGLAYWLSRDGYKLKVWVELLFL